MSSIPAMGVPLDGTIERTVPYKFLLRPCFPYMFIITPNSHWLDSFVPLHVHVQDEVHKNARKLNR